MFIRQQRNPIDPERLCNRLKKRDRRLGGQPDWRLHEILKLPSDLLFELLERNTSACHVRFDQRRFCHPRVPSKLRVQITAESLGKVPWR